MRSRSPTGHWMSSSCVAASRRPMLVGSGVSRRTRRTCETRRTPLAQWQALRVQGTHAVLFLAEATVSW